MNNDIDIDAFEVVEKPRRQGGPLFFSYWLSEGRILKCPVGPMWFKGSEGKFAARPDDVEHNRRLIKEAIQRAQEAVRKRIEREVEQVLQVKQAALRKPPRPPFVRPAVVAPAASTTSADHEKSCRRKLWKICIIKSIFYRDNFTRVIFRLIIFTRSFGRSVYEIKEYNYGTHFLLYVAGNQIHPYGFSF